MAKGTLFAVLAGAALAGGIIYMKKKADKMACSDPEGFEDTEAEAAAEVLEKELQKEQAKNEAKKMFEDFKTGAKAVSEELLSGLKKAAADIKEAAAGAKKAVCSLQEEAEETCEEVCEEACEAACEEADEAAAEAEKECGEIRF